MKAGIEESGAGQQKAALRAAFGEATIEMHVTCIYVLPMHLSCITIFLTPRRDRPSADGGQYESRDRQPMGCSSRAV